jgi:hypothetical protein
MLAVLSPSLLARAQAVRDGLHPELRAGYGGPLNGQVKRQEMMREIFAAVHFDAVVETGTFRGSTAEFLRAESKIPVFTVEIDPRLFHYCRRRFRGDRGVNVFLGDSVTFLRHLGEDLAFPKERVLFYLDAHGGDPLPLADEVRAIDTYWDNYVAIIDDFRVPTDPGYGFDDWGDGNQLTLSYLPFAEIGSVALFWPAARSNEETGFRRGCVLLATDKMTSELEQLTSVRTDHRVEDAPDRPRFEVPPYG